MRHYEATLSGTVLLGKRSVVPEHRYDVRRTTDWHDTFGRTPAGSAKRHFHDCFAHDGNTARDGRLEAPLENRLPNGELQTEWNGRCGFDLLRYAKWIHENAHEHFSMESGVASLIGIDRRHDAYW
jgi:hypothetical protein